MTDIEHSRATDARPTIALVVAAGRGSRLGADRPKQYLPIAGTVLLRRTLDALLAHRSIDAVRVVIHADDRAAYDAAVTGLDLLAPVTGGATRRDSVRLGLESLAAHSPARVLIHDAARPFVTPALIDGVLAGLDSAPGALPAIAVNDTLKRGLDGRVAGTVDRGGLWRAQTPQGFHFEPILAAHRACDGGPEMTDDVAVAEAAGLDVVLTPGAEENFKVTTPEDVTRAAAAIRAAGGTGLETRVGNGFDVHRFGLGQQVVLCGVPIAHDRGLVGHSDADVALHALTDAILGALGAGDIGSHFPPSDDRWKGAPSRHFVGHAAALAAERGARITHVDITIVCERPRIGPHRDAMRSAVADMLGIDTSRVSVKATTTEGLGFTGRGEGIAAQATATVMMDPAAG